eukprot:2426544-Amphidinium_carterae.4
MKSALGFGTMSLVPSRRDHSHGLDFLSWCHHWCGTYHSRGTHHWCGTYHSRAPAVLLKSKVANITGTMWV